jgi:hypothetical protein
MAQLIRITSPRDAPGTRKASAAPGCNRMRSDIYLLISTAYHVRFGRSWTPVDTRYLSENRSVGGSIPPLGTTPLLKAL